MNVTRLTIVIVNWQVLAPNFSERTVKDPRKDPERRNGPSPPVPICQWQSLLFYGEHLALAMCLPTVSSHLAHLSRRKEEKKKEGNGKKRGEGEDEEKKRKKEIPESKTKEFAKDPCEYKDLG